MIRGGIVGSDCNHIFLLGNDTNCFTFCRFLDIHFVYNKGEHGKRPAVPAPPSFRNLPDLLAESRFPPAGSTAFYRSYASRSLFVPSPSVRDRYGRDLSEGGKPVMVQDWGPEYRGGRGDLRLVASRAKALGFMDSDRRIWWVPYNPS